MKKIYLLFLSASILITLSSCSDYVTAVDPLVTAVEDSELNSEVQVPFLARGVETRFAFAFCRTDLCAAGLSDELIFDRNVPNASFPSFEEIDAGEIQLINNSVDLAYNSVGQFRYYADYLITRINSIPFTDSTVKNDAYFTGYFYGGYARYLYASLFGLNPTQGGSPIDNGPFIGSDEMYTMAIEKFRESLKYQYDNFMIRAVNSVIARAYLFRGDYANASIYAANGLINGDAPFQALHNTNEYNYWWAQAGALRAQFVADRRFKEYIDADPNEADRIKLDSIMGNNNLIYYFQAVYPEPDSPQNIITWQENNLIRAELILRGSGSGDALGIVNEVRSSHGIAPLSSVDLDVIYTERDKELFASANRLVDQRRFDRWHLGAGTWQYLPVTEQERNGNPHIN